MPPDSSEQPGWRNEPGFRAAVNEAQGGRPGLHGLGGPRPPPPSKTFLSAELGARARRRRALHASPSAAGPRGRERRPGGHGGSGELGLGWPLYYPLRCSRAHQIPSCGEGRDRSACLMRGEPESREGHHCGGGWLCRLAGVYKTPSYPRPPPFLCPSPEILPFAPPPVVTWRLVTALGAEDEALCRVTFPL